ncbi:hypothetical protein C8J56DRAFT_405133 [Mycena floridula]|nr:hypothetical protein C8J56DRAFT_405133 [Mycena floridula]
MLPLSVPANPRLRGQATPGDIGSITEEMQSLATSDYRGSNQGECGSLILFWVYWFFLSGSFILSFGELGCVDHLILCASSIA